GPLHPEVPGRDQGNERGRAGRRRRRQRPKGLCLSVGVVGSLSGGGAVVERRTFLMSGVVFLGRRGRGGEGTAAPMFVAGAVPARGGLVHGSGWVDPPQPPRARTGCRSAGRRT